jgi:hypothetical protein
MSATDLWRWSATPREAPVEPAGRPAALAGIALLGALWGCVVAAAGINALYLCVSLVGCAFILRDFRVGVVLLILLMPVSRSQIFPHALLGVTGLNPLNLLLAATLASCLFQALFDGSIRRFLPRPLLWLYLTPMLVAGLVGSRHVGDIAPGFYMFEALEFNDAPGYLRELLVKPALLVAFGLLVGAAVARSEKPERFVMPTLISIWVMAAMVVVFTFLSGVGMGRLASSTSREFLSPLGMHANELGRLYAFAYALLLFTWVEVKEAGLRLALAVSMALIVVALLLTFSRGAFFGFIVVNVLFLCWRRDARTLILFGLAAAVALLLLPDAVYHRVLHGTGEGWNAISAGRIDGIWLPLLPEVLRSPVYGNGLGSILWSDAMHRADGVTVLGVTHPHNAYLECALDTGFAGLAAVCGYFVHVWRGFRRLSTDASLSPRLRGFYTGAAAGLAGLLISGVADSSLMPRPEQAFLWLAIGMMYGELDRRRGG